MRGMSRISINDVSLGETSHGERGLHVCADKMQALPLHRYSLLGGGGGYRSECSCFRCVFHPCSPNIEAVSYLPIS